MSAQTRLLSVHPDPDSAAYWAADKDNRAAGAWVEHVGSRLPDPAQPWGVVAPAADKKERGG